MIENFGKNVARLRKEYGYSQEQLAKEIEVNRQTISNIERGARYPTFETLEKIAKLFKATPTQLFGTPKEIAVSDTPIILDRIDEYNSKIQAILQVPDIIDKYKKDIERLSNQVRIIEDFVTRKPEYQNGEPVLDISGNICYDLSPYERIPSETIERIATDARVIINLFERYPMTDYNETPVLDDNGNIRYNPSLYEQIPIKTIEEIASNIRYINNNKDDI